MSFSHNICLNAEQYHHITTDFNVSTLCFNIFFSLFYFTIFFFFFASFVEWVYRFVFTTDVKMVCSFFLDCHKRDFLLEKSVKVWQPLCYVYICVIYIDFHCEKEMCDAHSIYLLVLSVAWQQIETEMVENGSMADTLVWVYLQISFSTYPHLPLGFFFYMADASKKSSIIFYLYMYRSLFVCLFVYLNSYQNDLK